MPYADPNEIAAIAAEMNESLSDNNGLQEGVSFLSQGPKKHSPIIESDDDSYSQHVPYSIPRGYRPVVELAPYGGYGRPKPVVESSERYAPPLRLSQPASVPAVPKPAPVSPPSFGLVDRKLII